jgi:hypothetical protein
MRGRCGLFAVLLVSIAVVAMHGASNVHHACADAAHDVAADVAAGVEHPTHGSGHHEPAHVPLNACGALSACAFAVLVVLRRRARHAGAVSRLARDVGTVLRDWSVPPDPPVPRFVAA